MCRLLLISCLLLPFLNGQPVGIGPLDYFELTQDQQSQLALAQRGYADWQTEQRKRIEQVETELREETERIPLDPMAIGLRFAELETIRRQDAEHRRDLVRSSRAILSSQQLARAEALETALRLQPIAGSADCAFLLDGEPRTPCGLLPIDLRTPSGPRPQQLGFIFDPLGGGSTAKLREFLGFTAQQSVAYLANMEGLRRDRSRLENELICAERRAADALAASPLSPAAIGAAKAASIEAHRAIGRRWAEAVAANQALLTGPQQERLKLLEEARSLIDNTNVAVENALLPDGPEPIGPSVISGIPTAILRSGNFADPCRAPAP